jgi:hypothetical protein
LQSGIKIKEKDAMLKEVLSVSGKPGLYKMISQGKNMLVVESLVDQKRIPVYTKDKTVSLNDVSMFTYDENVRLSRIFQSIKEKENGEIIAFSPAITPEELRAYFSQILPDFDRKRVYPSDIKKVMNWYNLLVNAGLTDFSEETEEAEETGEAGETGETGEAI